MKKLSLFLLLLLSSSSWATGIAVTGFELLDLTLKPSDPKRVSEINAQEQKKVAMINQLVAKGITNTEGFTLIPISEQDRKQADESVGYLFDCAQCSAELGRNHGADYILIGRLHKPTYLFSYLIVRIFDVKNNTLLKEFRSEIKGDPNKSIPGAIANLMHKMDKSIPH